MTGLEPGAHSCEFGAQRGIFGNQMINLRLAPLARDSAG
jgi:hypothetical protein